MSSTNELHAPTDAFRRRLEGEIVRTFRTADGQRGGYGMRTQRWRIAALLVAALGVGAAGGVAYGQVAEARQRDELVAAARAEAQLAEVRVELARTQLAAVQRRHQIGAIGRDVVATAEADLRRAEAGLGKARLNLDEVQASAAPARDDIAAPLVGGRDYVRERMLLDMEVAQQRLATAERAVEEAQNRNRAGLLSGLGVLEARAAVTSARADMQLLGQRLQLRQELLRDGLDAGTATRREQRLALVQALAVTHELHTLAQARLAHVRERHRLGQADQVELLRAELEVAERAVELQSLQRQLDAHGRGT